MVALNTSFSQEQKCEEVYFHGSIVDTSMRNGYYNMMIVNITTGRGVFGNVNGTFSTYCRANDSIVISLKNYSNISLRIKPDENCQMKFDTVIDFKYENIQPVIIKPLKTLAEIKEEREALAKRETRTVTGVNIFESPITAIYEALSKKERAKRWIAQMKYKDDQRAILKDLIRLYTSYDIVNLPEDEFDQFIDFLNADPDFLKTASEMELVTFIKDKFEHYQRLKLNAPTHK